jgi:hypothetical protein
MLRAFSCGGKGMDRISSLLKRESVGSKNRILTGNAVRRKSVGVPCPQVSEIPPFGSFPITLDWDTAIGMTSNAGG